MESRFDDFTDCRYVNVIMGVGMRHIKDGVEELTKGEAKDISMFWKNSGLRKKPRNANLRKHIEPRNYLSQERPELDYESASFEYDPVDFDLVSASKKSSAEFARKLPLEEHTLGIIKPEALVYREEIVKAIVDDGFNILKTRTIQLTPEQASDFYEEHFGKLWFPTLVLRMCKGPIMVMCLSKQNAIEDYKALIGPADVSVARRYNSSCLRARFGLKGDKSTNGLHGSEDRESAEKEIHFFFGRMYTEPSLGVDSHMQYIQEKVIPILTKGLIVLCNKQIKPRDPRLWLADWLLSNSPTIPHEPKFLITQCQPDKISDV